MAELTDKANEFLAAFDAKDLDGIMRSFTADAQGVDEISRRWIRGGTEIEGYLRQLLDAVSDVRTTLSDPEERIWGDIGLLTCWLEQDYTLEGNAQHVSAPTTIVFHREGGEWKGSLFHSVPLPEQG